MPQGRSPSSFLVSASRRSSGAPLSSANATIGSAPPSATAAANSATSDTRVIGPCTIGRRSFSDRASGASSKIGRASTAVRRCPSIALSIACSTAATCWYCFRHGAAKQASWPIGRRPRGRIAPAHRLGGDQRPQPGEAEAVAARDQRARGRVAGANQDAEVLAALAVADGDGLAAREVADQGAQRRRQLDLVHEQQLAVEHAAGDADGAARRRDVRRQAAAQVQRQARSARATSAAG